MESKLQRKIINYLFNHGWYVLKVVSSNKPGHPDIEAVRKVNDVPTVIYIETKDKGKKPTKLQLYRHEQLREQGFTVLVIDDWEVFKLLKNLFV